LCTGKHFPAIVARAPAPGKESYEPQRSVEALLLCRGGSIGACPEHRSRRLTVDTTRLPRCNESSGEGVHPIAFFQLILREADALKCRFSLRKTTSSTTPETPRELEKRR
jgi:hypothetical protein